MNRWLSLSDAAEHLRLSVDAFRHKVRSGLVPKPDGSIGPRSPRWSSDALDKAKVIVRSSRNADEAVEAWISRQRQKHQDREALDEDAIGREFPITHDQTADTRIETARGANPRRRRRLRKTIYFIQSQNGGPIKIGQTEGAVERRLAALQIGSAERLIIVGRTIKFTEDELHRDFAADRLSGEWFSATDRLEDLIRSIGGCPYGTIDQQNNERRDG